MNWMIRLTPLVVVVACQAAAPDGDGTPNETGSQPVTAGVVDSALPMPVLLERFRKGLSEPQGLRSDIMSRDALVRAVMEALEHSDTLRFEQLAVNRAEWAWLYYPTNAQSQPPYELPPALAWFQLQETNRKGVFRALREYGARRLDYQGYECDAEPVKEAENAIWTHCVVTLARDDEPAKTLGLFGAILERGGRFAILSYDNDF
jgi:hypothetical protein